MRRPSLVLSLLTCALCAQVGACGDRVPPRDLRDLVVRDSTYYDPSTSRPHSGPVFRPFRDESKGTQIEGTLLDGIWQGELVVFHESGRIRYMGRFDHGQRCGAWTENADDVERESLLAQVRAEVATLALYPPCPPER